MHFGMFLILYVNPYVKVLNLMFLIDFDHTFIRAIHFCVLLILFFLLILKYQFSVSLCCPCNMEGSDMRLLSQKEQP